MKIPVLGRKLARNIQDYGAAETARKSLASVCDPIYRRTVFRIYRIDLREAQPAVPSLNGFRIVDLKPDNSDLVGAIEQRAEWLRGGLSESLAGGSLCLCLVSEDGLAGFNLVDFERMSMPVIRLELPLRPGEAWSNHITVAPSVRLLGLASQLRYAMFRELRRRGIHRFYGGTLVSNQPSLRLSRRVGFKEIADIEYRKVLGRENWTLRRVR